MCPAPAWSQLLLASSRIFRTKSVSHGVPWVGTKEPLKCGLFRIGPSCAKTRRSGTAGATPTSNQKHGSENPQSVHYFRPSRAQDSAWWCFALSSAFLVHVPQEQYHYNPLYHYRRPYTVASGTPCSSCLQCQPTGTLEHAEVNTKGYGSLHHMHVASEYKKGTVHMT